MRHLTGKTLGAFGASIVLSLLAVLPVAATSPITVTINQFLAAPYWSEGVSKIWPIASFSDTSACSGPGACNPGSAYTASIDLWGDNSGPSSGTVTLVSQSGTTGNYSVSALHTYRDEFNCGSGPSTCGYLVLVKVHNNITSTSGSGSCTACVAIKDQPIRIVPNSTTFAFGAVAGVTYSGPLGYFHDDNNQAVAADGNGAEFAVAINWGDGTVTQGGFTVPASCNPTPGPGVGQGCTIGLMASPGGHAYATPGDYPVTITVTDGRNPSPVGLTDAAVVKASRDGVTQSGAGLPGTRGVVPSASAAVGPRLAWGRDWWQAFWSWAA